MLSYRWNVVHSFVVRVAFIIRRNDAVYFLPAQYLESFKSEMSIQKQKAIVLLGIYDQRLDQTDLADEKLGFA